MKKLNGYRPSHRNKWLFVKQNILSIQELSLWEYYADIVDFDKRHEKYGLFEVYFDEISLLLNKDENTIRNWHNKLLYLGFISITNRKHIFKLSCHERYVNTGKWEGKAAEYGKKEKDQSIENILESFGTNLQIVKEKLQSFGNNKQDKGNKTIKTDSIAIGSYKDEIGFISTRQHSLRSDKEYQKIKEELGPTSLSIEDMKWIDLNVKEDPNVPN
ncbi:MAG: hypothetical protein V1922_04925 [bacterium]